MEPVPLLVKTADGGSSITVVTGRGIPVVLVERGQQGNYYTDDDADNLRASSRSWRFLQLAATSCAAGV